MVFNSIAFVVFAVVFYSLWPLARKCSNLRYLYIISFSFLFYGWWDWRYVPLLLMTALVDFWAGLAIEKYRSKKLILLVSLSSNLLVLGFFKYVGFFTRNLNMASSWFGLSPLPILSFVLPVGISFYTFQSMSYTIDIYRGTFKPTRNPLHFLSAVSMFPHLVAGPIMRAAYLLPQLREGRSATVEERWEGARLIVHGFFKKMVIADNLALPINSAFAGGIPYGNALNWWLISFMFAFQIYCDFSGYSDIARGLAKWMGYDFSLNFRHPYGSTSITEFWRRWHMSLSFWFRDYVYIPLGGSRQGVVRSHVNMWISMLLSGLWHGASWTFVIWGALHAFYMSVERVSKWPDRLMQWSLGRSIACILVFLQVCVAWIFFRADSLEQAGQIVGSMFSFHWGPLLISKTVLFFLLLGVIREIYCFFNLDWRKILTPEVMSLLEPATLGLVVAACIYLRGAGGAFIYFQF